MCVCVCVCAPCWRLARITYIIPIANSDGGAAGSEEEDVPLRAWMWLMGNRGRFRKAASGCGHVAYRLRMT